VSACDEAGWSSAAAGRSLNSMLTGCSAPRLRSTAGPSARTRRTSCCGWPRTWTACSQQHWRPRPWSAGLDRQRLRAGRVFRHRALPGAQHAASRCHAWMNRRL